MKTETKILIESALSNWYLDSEGDILRISEDAPEAAGRLAVLFAYRDRVDMDIDPAGAWERIESIEAEIRERYLSIS